MKNVTFGQITAAAAGLKDPKARDRAVQWLRRWQKAVPELFKETLQAVEPPRKADPPWDVLDDSVICLAMDENGDWFAHDGYVKPDIGGWFFVTAEDCWDLSYLKFDPGNRPWDKSIVYRPGHEPEGVA